MRPLGLTLETEGLAVDRAWIEIRGLNMDMGLNRTQLSRHPEGQWRGETILPICSRRRMDWEAAVLDRTLGRRKFRRVESAEIETARS